MLAVLIAPDVSDVSGVTGMLRPSFENSKLLLLDSALLVVPLEFVCVLGLRLRLWASIILSWLIRSRVAPSAGAVAKLSPPGVFGVCMDLLSLNLLGSREPNDIS